jgi:DNA-directed RNA polymerase specialized sigma subunit
MKKKEWVSGILSEAKTLNFRINSQSRLIDWYTSLDFAASSGLERNFDLLCRHVAKRNRLLKLKEDIKAAIESLTGKERKLFWLRFIKNVSVEEACKTLGISKRMGYYYHDKALDAIGDKLLSQGYCAFDE